MTLDYYREPLAYELAFAMEAIDDPRCPFEQFSKLCVEATAKFRALAIIGLLATGDHELFCHNLICSGRVRQSYLQRARKSGATNDHHFASGRFEPMLDALAAGDGGLARMIFASSPAEWRTDQEYEDDYCYAQIIGRLIAGADGDFNPFVERLAAFAAGETVPRLDVSRALIERSEADFAVAFADLVEARHLQIERDRERGQLEDAVVLANRQIYVEGLALLRLAGALSLATEPEYMFCPSLARLPMRVPFPGD